MSGERRSDTRYSINQIIKVNDFHENYFWAAGKNVSRGGFSAMANCPVEPMAQLFAMLTIPGEQGEKTIKVEGYVTYSEMDADGNCHFGARINEISPDDELYFNEFVKKCEEHTCPE